MSTKKNIEYLSAAEAAEILHINVRTLANWRCLGIGPAFIRASNGARHGVVLYTRDDVDAFLMEHRVSTTDCK